jgi:hypothetical protein
MTSDLTEADLVDYDVAFTDGIVLPARGAYIMTDVTGLLAIKDHRHKHVLLVRAEAVQSIGRTVGALLRCEHATLIIKPGLFVPTANAFQCPYGCAMEAAG